VSSRDKGRIQGEINQWFGREDHTKVTAEAWELMKQDPGEGGFMFSTTWNGKHIHKHMTTLGKHSGASYGIGMRQMQYIAKNGWEAFVSAMLRTN
jgi:hypothetical protein